MRKFRLYFDKDKESLWLNEMAAQGWAMTGFFAGLYTFEECEPGRYLYQVDFGDHFGTVSENYSELMKDMDIEIVQCWGYWVVLRRKAVAGPFELYTDVDSQIEHYKKIRTMFKAVTIFEMLCLLLVTAGASISRDTVNWLFVVLLSAFVMTFICITVRTGDTLRKLRERKTGIEEPRQKTSPILMIGLLINAARLVALDKLPDLPANLLGILAIVLMLAGIAQTAAARRS